MTQNASAASEAIERLCQEHGQFFIERSLQVLGLSELGGVSDVCSQGARALYPIVIDDYRILTDQNKTDIRRAYFSNYGVAYFIVRNPNEKPIYGGHPLFEITKQLSGVIPIDHPLPHPLEGHAEAVSRFGPSDGTVKVYNLPGKGGAAGYREQAETNEIFDMHHDGLGSGGTVQTVILYMDSPPMFGGFTYFQNILLLALQLAIRDEMAFRSLFLPDALTIIRPRGKGAIKVR